MRLAVLSCVLGIVGCLAVLYFAGFIQPPPFAQPQKQVRRGIPHISRFENGHLVTGPSTSSWSPVASSQPARSPSSTPRAFGPPVTVVSFENGQFRSTTTSGGKKSVSVYPRSTAVRPPVSAPIPSQPAPAPVASAAPSARECALRLNEPQLLFAAGRNIRIQLHDYGAESIAVQIDYGPTVRLRKQKNPDPREMSELTLIHQERGTRIYHLNAAHAPIGCYLVRIVGEGA